MRFDHSFESMVLIAHLRLLPVALKDLETSSQADFEVLRGSSMSNPAPQMFHTLSKILYSYCHVKTGINDSVGATGDFPNLPAPCGGILSLDSTDYAGRTALVGYTLDQDLKSAYIYSILL